MNVDAFKDLIVLGGEKKKNDGFFAVTLTTKRNGWIN